MERLRWLLLNSKRFFPLSTRSGNARTWALYLELVLQKFDVIDGFLKHGHYVYLHQRAHSTTISSRISVHLRTFQTVIYETSECINTSMNEFHRCLPWEGYVQTSETQGLTLAPLGTKCCKVFKRSLILSLLCCKFKHHVLQCSLLVQNL